MNKIPWKPKLTDLVFELNKGGDICTNQQNAPTQNMWTKTDQKRCVFSICGNIVKKKMSFNITIMDKILWETNLRSSRYVNENKPDSIIFPVRGNIVKWCYVKRIAYMSAWRKKTIYIWSMESWWRYSSIVYQTLLLLFRQWMCLLPLLISLAANTSFVQKYKCIC